MDADISSLNNLLSISNDPPTFLKRFEELFFNSCTPNWLIVFIFSHGT